MNVKAKGLGDIAAAIIIQPEYERCQVNHFWRWFIRGDEPPTEARLGELVREFNRVGRRPNDFISYLVNQPEFNVEAESTGGPVTLLQVKSILDRCSRCHANVHDQRIPNFSVLPIGGATDHPYWAERITRRLDLAHDGAKRSMPPKSSAWQPNVEEIQLMKAWIAGGVRDEASKITIDPKKTQEWLKP